MINYLSKKMKPYLYAIPVKACTLSSAVLKQGSSFGREDLMELSQINSTCLDGVISFCNRFQNFRLEIECHIVPEARLHND